MFEIMRLLVLPLFGVLCLQIILSNAAMSEAQLKAAVRLVRNVCQPKSKTTDEQIEKMREGNYDTMDDTGRCYTWCMLNMNKLISKENGFNYDTAIAMASKSLPEGRKVASLASMEACKDSAKTKSDKCIAAWEIVKCLYFSNPPNFFLA